MTDKTIAFSLLDLAPIPEGSSAREAFSHSIDLARLAEKRGYHRYWLGENHNNTRHYQYILTQYAGHCQCCNVGVNWLSGGEYHHAASGVWRRDVA